jgi:hypothetical protein
MSKGKTEQPGQGTKTQRLYREWLTADEKTRRLIENSLTNICVSSCRGLIPPVESYSLKNWKRRWTERYSWCQRFVRSELRSQPADECQFIGRRCNLRLKNEITAFNRRSRYDYLSTVERDEKGRFVKADPVRVRQDENFTPGRIIYQKPSNPRQSPSVE